jgi:thioredoxin-dependent peroxiredoxin
MRSTGAIGSTGAVGVAAVGAAGALAGHPVAAVGVLRSTFLLDDQGRVERAWHNVKADGHAASVLSQLRS